MKKILIVAHYSRFLVQFELRNVSILQEKGYEVHYACNYKQEDMYEAAPRIVCEHGVVLHQIDFVRSPFNIFKNIKAYKQLIQLMKDEHFSGVHCHTPMAGAIARLAANATRTGPVIYTAHGFHFYKGCPLHNRLIYETAERFMARYTDALITINQEDYAAAQTFKLRGKAYHIMGIGIDVKAIQSLTVDRKKKKETLNIPRDAFVFISVGELIKRKNHETVIKAFGQANLDNTYYLICGSGKLEKRLKRSAKKFKNCSNVIFLGFRTDINELLKMSDTFLFPSYQEGLPVALMEAMAAGLACIASDIRGNVDLMCNSEIESLLEVNQLQQWENKIRKIRKNEKERLQMGQNNIKQILAFDSEKVEKSMKNIYQEIIGE